MWPQYYWTQIAQNRLLRTKARLQVFYVLLNSSIMWAHALCHFQLHVAFVPLIQKSAILTLQQSTANISFRLAATCSISSLGLILMIYIF